MGGVSSAHQSFAQLFRAQLPFLNYTNILPEAALLFCLMRSFLKQFETSKCVSVRP